MADTVPTASETVRLLAEEATRIGRINGVFVAVLALNLDGTGLLLARSHNSPAFYRAMSELLGLCKQREHEGAVKHIDVPALVN